MAVQIPDSCEDLLREMVGFNTVNASISGKPDPERPLCDYLEALAEAQGLSTQRFPVSGESHNLLVSHRVSEGAPYLLFESHLDTVSIEGMTVDPFVTRIENGRMYGRGTSDTKGSGAAMLWALTRYAAESPPSGNVAIIYTTDEEVGKTGVRTFVERHLPGLGWTPAGVIVGEPTRSRPVVAHNGVVRWRIRTRGIAVHSCDPGQGRSAVSMMTDVIRTLESEYIPDLTASHPLTGKAQCSINVIRGGVQVNIVPEHCEIRVDRRLVPGEDPDTVLPAVEQALDRLRGRIPQLSVSQDSPEMVDYPLDPRGGEGFASRVQAALKQMGLPSEAHGVGYGTDASSFSAAGVPALVLGPGDIAQAHTADEWLDLEQLRLAADIYLNIMRSPLETGRNDDGPQGV